jgi:hypothetical protein
MMRLNRFQSDCNVCITIILLQLETLSWTDKYVSMSTLGTRGIGNGVSFTLLLHGPRLTILEFARTLPVLTRFFTRIREINVEKTMEKK